MINMNEQPSQQKQQNSLFAKLLRERKLDFQKDQRALDRELEKKLKMNNNAANPQKIYAEEKLIVGSMQKKQQSIQKSDSVLEDTGQSQHLRESKYLQDVRNQQKLSQNARQFVQRLRKQRQYNKGKFLLLRKKQEQRKQSQRKKMEEIKREYLEQYNRKKLEKAITNIILHQSRANYRYSQSIDRPIRNSHHRSKTENDDHNEFFSLTPIMQQKLPPISQTKQRKTNAYSAYSNYKR